MRVSMSFLFPIEVNKNDIPAIPGLLYLPEYVTAAQEKQLTAAIDQGVWDSTWDRRRQLFGGTYGNKSEITQVIPDWGRKLAERMLLGNSASAGLRQAKPGGEEVM